jgi:hypothetical protein
MLQLSVDPVLQSARRFISDTTTSATLAGLQLYYHSSFRGIEYVPVNIHLGDDQAMVGGLCRWLDMVATNDFDAVPSKEFALGRQMHQAIMREALAKIFEGQGSYRVERTSKQALKWTRVSRWKNDLDAWSCLYSMAIR